MSDSSAAIARVLQRSVSDADYGAVVDFLRADPDAQAILEELSTDRDLEVRGWVPGAAGQILGEAAIPLIRRMMRDRDTDIQGLAMDALEAIDPTLLDAILPELRRKVRSGNYSEVVSAAWRLAERGDVETIGLLEAFRDRHESWLAECKAATVILLVLTAPDEVALRIRAHDHDHMTWLTYGAVIVRTAEAIDALEDCRANAPDERCRRLCEFALANDLPKRAARAKGSGQAAS